MQAKRDKTDSDKENSDQPESSGNADILGDQEDADVIF
jgi:hypothetical protein